MRPLQKLFLTVSATFRNCAVRFPVTVCFVFALTGFLFYLIATERNIVRMRLLATWNYYLSMGILLSLSLHLWSEEVKRRRTRLLAQATVHLLLAADAVFLYYCATETRFIEIFIAHAAGVFAVGLSVFYLSFLKEKNDIAAWNFAQNVLGSFALAIIVGMVMSGGLCLLAYSLHQLFGMEVSYKCYLYILALCSACLPLLMFLGLLPQGAQKHDNIPKNSPFVNGIIRYLFLPLAGGYLLVLYIYATRILVRWELPDGWVSWLVVTLMAGCIAIEFGLYPARMQDKKRDNERIACLLPALTLPLLLLMSVGIARRFMDYGITINRLYLATLNVWFYFVCVTLIAGRARRISWIPVSFSAAFLLTSALPVNYASITKRALHNEVAQQLAQNGSYNLPLSEAEYEQWLSTLPEATRRQMNDKLDYLSNYFGKETISDLVDKDIAFYNYANRLPAACADREEKRKDENSRLYVSHKTAMTVPEGYLRFRTVRMHHTIASAQDTLCLPLDGQEDTLCLPLDTLNARDGESKLPPPLFKTRKGNAFISTYFNLRQDETGNTEIDINGYLFYNE